MIFVPKRFIILVEFILLLTFPEYKQTNDQNIMRVMNKRPIQLEIKLLIFSL